LRATIEFDLGDPAAAGRLLGHAEQLVGAERTPEAAQVHHRVSNHALRTGKIQPARQSAERAIEIATEVGPRVVLVEATSTLALAVGITDDRDAGVEMARKARQMALESGFVAQAARAFRIEWLIVHSRDGLTDSTFAVSKEGLAYTEAHCGPRARADFRSDLARGYVEAGRLKEAKSYIDLLLASEVDELRRLSVLQAAGLRSMGVGALDEAAVLLSEATEIAERFQSGSETGYNSRILAELARRQGRLPEALQLVNEALELQLPSDNLSFTRETITETARIANAMLAADTPGASQLAEETRILVNDFDGPGLANQAMRALMDLEVLGFDAEVTQAVANPVVAMLESAGFLYEAAQARLLVLDHMMVSQRDDKDELKRQLELLADIAQGHGMDWISERASSYARIAKVRIGERSRSESDAGVQVSARLPHHLTEREVEVMSLLAEGLTNKGIGERLYVSTRTVSTHISNLLAKLAVSNRGEAAAAYHRLGLDQIIDMRDPAPID
jgi:DNA-binding CsgD family transcriptional regulator/tetratricopeptide (TPR) repeat protein